MNNINEFISLFTSNVEGASMYLSFAGGVILSVTLIVLVTTLHLYNNSKKD